MNLENSTNFHLITDISLIFFLPCPSSFCVQSSPHDIFFFLCTLKMICDSTFKVVIKHNPPYFSDLQMPLPHLVSIRAYSFASLYSYIARYAAILCK